MQETPKDYTRRLAKKLGISHQSLCINSWNNGEMDWKRKWWSSYNQITIWKGLLYRNLLQTVFSKLQQIQKFPELQKICLMIV